MSPVPMTDGLFETPPRDAAALQTGLGAYLGESAGNALLNSPLAQLGRVYELEQAQRAPGAQDLTPDQANARIEAAGLGDVMTKRDAPIKDSVLDVMIRHNQEQRDRDVTLARGPSGWIPSALSAVTGLGAAAVDPLNAAATFIPVVGEEHWAGLMARAGTNVFARAGVRAALAGAQGAAGMVPLEMLHFLEQSREGRDYAAGDFLRNVAFGGALGAALHVPGGALADVWRGSVSGKALYPFGPGESGWRLDDLPERVREDTLRMVLSRLRGGQQVDAAQAIQDLAAHDPRIAESIGYDAARDPYLTLDQIWNHFANRPAPEHEPAAEAASTAASDLPAPGSTASVEPVGGTAREAGREPGEPPPAAEGGAGAEGGAAPSGAEQGGGAAEPLSTEEQARQRDAIRSEVTQAFVAAGRPEEEAGLLGRLAAARYAVRAARLGFSSPLDLWRRADIEIRRGLEESPEEPGAPEGPARQFGIPANAPVLHVFGEMKPARRKAAAAAAAGSEEAARQFVEEGVSPETLNEARKNWGSDVLFVPVRAEGAALSARNKVPTALAHIFAAATGAGVEPRIVEGARGGARKAIDRLVSRPQFGGPVERGRKYVLVDDVARVGTTLAELAHHIRASGGEVAGVVTLANASKMAHMAPAAERAALLESRLGSAVREHLGIEPGALTAAETEYLLKFPAAAALRAGIAAARGGERRRQAREAEGARETGQNAAGEGAAGEGAAGEEGRVLEQRPGETTWTKERVRRLRELAAQGVSFGKIANELGLSRGAVIGKANRLGIASQQTAQRPPGYWRDGGEGLREIRRLNDEGKSLDEIAAHLDAAYTTISRVMSEHGIELKNSRQGSFRNEDWDGRLREMEARGLTRAEMAQELGAAVGTVNDRFQRMRQRENPAGAAGLGVKPKLSGWEILPDGTMVRRLHQFAGEHALTADRAMLDEAQRLEAAGVDRQEIWHRTGWYRRPDGWRFEIDDSDVAFHAGALRKEPGAVRGGWRFDGRLGDLIDAPHLFAAYPDLAGVEVHVGYLEGHRGEFDPFDRTIHLAAQSDHAAMLNTLVHEIQHAVQLAEGWAPGGHLDTLRARTEVALYEIAHQIAALKGGNVRAELKGLRTKLRDQAERLARGLTPTAAQIDAYERILGEVEARNTAARRTMTAAERRASFPRRTESVPEAEQYNPADVTLVTPREGPQPGYDVTPADTTGLIEPYTGPAFTADERDALEEQIPEAIMAMSRPGTKGQTPALTKKEARYLRRYFEDWGIDHERGAERTHPEAWAKFEAANPGLVARYRAARDYVEYEQNREQAGLSTSMGFGGGPRELEQREEARGLAPPFYSALTRVAEGLKQAKASGQQWLATLRNAAGVKPEELDWVVGDWLKEQKGPVTREQLLDYLRANNLEIREVTRGENTALQKRIDDLGEEIGVLEALGDERWREASRERGALLRQVRQAKYQSLGLPGGENYRELLMLLPEKTGGERGPRGWGDTSGGTFDTANFRGGHWEEPNVVAHMRLDEVTGPDGKRYARLLEMQSDWHQQGRKRGYKDERERAALLEEIRKLGIAKPPEDVSLNDLMAAGADEDLQQRWFDNYASAGSAVPDAPFKTSWPELAMKRLIRYAADHGLDGIYLPADAESIARVEGWESIHHTADGKWMLPYGRNVTPIVERYLTELPRIANRLGKKYGAAVGKGEINIGPDEKAFREAERQGDSAAIADAVRDHMVPVHVLPLTDKLRDVALNEGFPMFQRGREGAPQGRVTFMGDGRKILEVFSRANASTGIHELSHIWMHELFWDAMRRGSPAQLIADRDAVLRALGRDVTGGHVRPEDLTTEEHERLARWFEQYLREGIAPSDELKSVFARFREWLIQIYRQIKYQLGDKISPEMRGVFDRLLATDEEIENARIRPKTVRRPRRRADLSLAEFLAGRGGVSASDPLAGDVRAIFGGNPFVPGFGRLIRENGRRLDESREAAHEAGYEIENAGDSTVRNLLDALAREARGEKQYPAGSERWRMAHERALDPEYEAYLRESEEAERERRDQRILEAFAAERTPAPDEATRARMVAHPDWNEADPFATFERVAAEDHYAGTEEGREHPGLPPDLPRTENGAVSDVGGGAPERGGGAEREHGAGARPGAGGSPERAGAEARRAGNARGPAGAVPEGRGAGDVGAAGLRRVSPATRAALAMEKQGLVDFDALRELGGFGDDPVVMVDYAADRPGRRLRLSEAIAEVNRDEAVQRTILEQGAACLMRAVE